MCGVGAFRYKQISVGGWVVLRACVWAAVCVCVRADTVIALIACAERGLGMCVIL